MEDAYLIKGGKPLKGEIKLSGAKNISLKVIVAALMFDDQVVLDNVPQINDVLELVHLIKELGGKAKFIGDNRITVDGRSITSNKISLLDGSKIRVSFMFFPVLLNKFKQCFIPNPGGCRIGARPIDRAVEGMKQLGVKVVYNHKTGFYSAEMVTQPSGSYCFPKSTHTGTELLILLSVLGKDEIILKNCALEPEIDQLIKFLNQAGAKIKRNGTTIAVNPVKRLIQQAPFSIVSDRNEAVTYASLAIATKGEIAIYPIQPLMLRAFIDKVKQIGGGVTQVGEEKIKFFYKGQLKPSTVETSPHPGFMTDWQPNWAVLMTQAGGESIITERVFENRFSYVEELRKLGAEIDFIKPAIKNPAKHFFFNVDPAKNYYQTIRIRGPKKLHRGVLTIADLRAGATLAIGALTAEGESVINGASILERGYENFVEKVRSLGGDIH